MEWYTFGQMLIHLRLGQKAATPDGRTLVRRPEGLIWTEGERIGALAPDQAASLLRPMAHL
ncbi:hypothetical protein D3C87_2097650 [compost metagenome]